MEGSPTDVSFAIPQHRHFRFRISTALLGYSCLLHPLLVESIHGLPEAIHAMSQFTGLLLFTLMIGNLIDMTLKVFQKRIAWQSGIEFAACLLIYLFIPIY